MYGGLGFILKDSSVWMVKRFFVVVLDMLGLGMSPTSKLIMTHIQPQPSLPLETSRKLS